jgi:ParB family chromosome partitioning protein
LGDAAESPAEQALTAQQREWLALLPRSSKELWQWCLAQPQDTLLRLLAFCAAGSINAVRVKTDAERDYRLQHADWLAAALQVDLTQWFTPTAENCFDRLSKAQIAQALREAGSPADATTLAHKKPQLAKIAEAKTAGTGWLPAPMRIQEWPDDEIGNAFDSENGEERVEAP